jgi:hypothetical protein
MRNRFVIGAAVLGGLAVLAGGALLGHALTESSSPGLRPVHSRSLVRRVADRVKLVFFKKPPRVSRAEVRALFAQESNEGTGPEELPSPDAIETQISSASPSGRASPGELVVVTKTLVARNRPGRWPVSPVAEPSVAMHGKRVLLTWNWGAAASEDGGRTFPLLLDPNGAMLGRPGGLTPPLAFCCDQLAYVAPRAGNRPELWFWVLQSDHATRDGRPRADEVIRLRWLVGETPFDDQNFREADFSAQLLSGERIGADAWLDQSRIAATRRYLFIAANAYDSNNHYYASYVMRMSLEDLFLGVVHPKVVQVGSRANGGAGFVGFARGATDTMYFGGSMSRSRLRVWKWPDDSPGPRTTDVTHGADADDAPYDCRRLSSVNWCARKANDDRVLAGWVAKGIVGFAWNAPANRAAGFPQPYVHVVQLDEDSLSLRDEPSIFLKNMAVNYSALVPNGRGEIGGLVLLGGANSYETCAAVARDPRSGRSVGWDLARVTTSDTDPERATGDYLGATTTSPGGNLWAGACMTFHGAGPHRAEVSFAVFGRAEDRPR